MSQLYYYDGTSLKPVGGTPTPPTPQVDNYTTAGTYTITPPAGAKYLFYEGIAGGGTGAVCSSSSSTGATGGSGGEYVSGFFPVAAVVGSGNLVVGAKGVQTSFLGLIALPGKSGSYTTGVTGGGDAGETAGGPATFNTGAPATPTSARFGGAAGGGFYLASGFVPNAAAGGTGGADSATYGTLKGGNGGAAGYSGNGTAGTAPGAGGGACPFGSTPGQGAPGGARMTWYF